MPTAVELLQYLLICASCCVVARAVCISSESKGIAALRYVKRNACRTYMLLCIECTCDSAAANGHTDFYGITGGVSESEVINALIDSSVPSERNIVNSL